jgi:hypothetical protein
MANFSAAPHVFRSRLIETSRQKGYANPVTGKFQFRVKQDRLRVPHDVHTAGQANSAIRQFSFTRLYSRHDHYRFTAPDSRLSAGARFVADLTAAPSDFLNRQNRA